MEQEYKIIMLGDYRSGKTSLIQMSHDSTFNEAQQSTIGIDFRISQVNVNGLQIMRVHKYDVGGGENFMRIVKNFMKRMHQAIIVYDVTNPEGLDSVQRWLDFINQSNSVNLQIIIVANKIDKIEQRVITPTQGITFAQQLGLQYFETSAKINIQQNLCLKVHSNLQLFIEQKLNKTQNKSLKIKCCGSN